MAPLRSLLLIVLVIHAGVAWAQPAPLPKPDAHEARQYFDSGRRHFDLAEYAAALDDFKSAYRTSDDPVYLYNIAVCFRMLEQRAEALRFFKNFLGASPGAPNRDEVQRRIAGLEAELADEARSRVQHPAPTADEAKAQLAVTAAPAEPRPRWRKPALIRGVVGGVVVVGLAVGLGVGLGARQSGDGRFAFPVVQF